MCARLPPHVMRLPWAFVQSHPCRRFVVLSAVFAGHWVGRVFDPPVATYRVEVAAGRVEAP